MLSVQQVKHGILLFKVTSLYYNKGEHLFFCELSVYIFYLYFFWAIIFFLWIYIQKDFIHIYLSVKRASLSS